MNTKKLKNMLVLIGVIFLLLMSTMACSKTNADREGKLGNQNSPEIKSGEQGNSQTEYELTEEGIIKPESAKKIIEDTAEQVIKALSTKDADTLAGFIHPEKGVRFTPYTHVSPDKDLIFTQEKIKNYFQDDNIYLWGHYDGTGEEIRLTPGKYYEKFVYSADYIKAEKIGYNEVLSIGNMLENQFEVYAKSIVVEYYFSGFDPKYTGMDWKSLRLVFEEDTNGWKLVGIIHNQWTI